ncbi:MAG: hypothetical protein K0M64_04245 [Rhizobium sp.]|nr:hypothetical protein [Rhizobium sp.]
MSDKRAALMKKYAPITKAQLKAVVVDYASALPEWSLLPDGTGVVRSFGPLQQMIWFQKMSSAAYRPTHVMNTTVSPIPRMLHQLLEVKHREIEVGRHEQKLPEVVAAMEQQFRPAIRKPLNIAEVLELCEVDSRRDSLNDLVMLAVLYAWLERKAEALECCSRMELCPLPTLAPAPEWEAMMRTFGGQLADAVERGDGRSFLEAAIEKQLMG